MIEAIDEILLQVSDMEASLRFYRDGLGLPLEPTGYGDDSHVAKLGSFRLLLHPDFDHDPPVTPRGSGILIHFRVKDVDAACAELRRRGIPITKEPRDIYDDRIATVTDPDGYPIHLSSPI